MTSTTPAMNGTADSSRSAISDSPATVVVTHERSTMSWWFRPGPVRISRGPALTKLADHDDLVGPEAVSELEEPGPDESCAEDDVGDDRDPRAGRRVTKLVKG